MLNNLRNVTNIINILNPIKYTVFSIPIHEATTCDTNDGGKCLIFYISGQENVVIGDWLHMALYT